MQEAGALLLIDCPRSRLKLLVKSPGLSMVADGICKMDDPTNARGPFISLLLILYRSRRGPRVSRLHHALHHMSRVNSQRLTYCLFAAWAGDRDPAIRSDARHVARDGHTPSAQHLLSAVEAPGSKLQEASSAPKQTTVPACLPLRRGRERKLPQARLTQTHLPRSIWPPLGLGCACGCW